MKPKLIHPVDVTITPFDSAATTLDPVLDDLEMPENANGEIEMDVQVKYKTPIEIKAQVKYNKFDEITGAPAGFESKGVGYILVDLETSKLLNKNDKITIIDGEAVEFYIIEEVPRVHYKKSNQKRIHFDYESVSLINNAQL